ncbi:MAG TPA: CoA transferase, partial [Roseomonas sp.]|nr:CoA transferase [Roseomonas sp.]
MSGRTNTEETTPMDGTPKLTESAGPARTPSAGALAGLRVVDLTRVLGGPYCTMVLSDHGADVIKLEPPQGDEVRDWGPPFNADGDASYFVGVNRNKRSVGLDLSKPAGREVLMRLLDGADVLIENFKPGSMEKWGLGYEAVLSKKFPRLIHCRVSGFGAEGPLGGFPGYDAVLQAMVGLMSINGTETSGPTRLGNPIVDIATGLFSTIAILMALHEREKSGHGQYC